MIVNVLTDEGTTVQVIQSSLPNVVEVYQTTAPEVVEIVTAGPQGPVGPAGATSSTASFVTTASFNSFTSSYNTGSFRGSFTGSLSGTASFAISASWAPSQTIDTGSLVTTASFNSFTSSYNTGSFTGSFTGSLFGTASWATNALTASYLSGYVSPFPFTGSALITGSLGITGSLNVTGGMTGSLSGTSSYAINALTASYLEGYISPFPFTGSALITGSLEITGSLIVTQGITGSLFGTASWAQNSISSSISISSSFALTSSYATNVGNLLRQEFTFSGSQTFTLSNNYGQVYSVEVQGQGLNTSQYTLVAPNQITINDTLDSEDYVVVLYSNTITGIQPYYSQAEVDALLISIRYNETFETLSKNLKGKPYALNYTSGKLTSIVYSIDGGNITKTLNYTGDKLTSLVLSGNTPTGISLTKTLTYTGNTLTNITYS